MSHRFVSLASIVRHLFAIGYAVAWIGVALHLAHMPTEVWLSIYLVGLVIDLTIIVKGYYETWLKPLRK